MDKAQVKQKIILLQTQRDALDNKLTKQVAKEIPINMIARSKWRERNRTFAKQIALAYNEIEELEAVLRKKPEVIRPTPVYVAKPNPISTIKPPQVKMMGKKKRVDWQSVNLEEDFQRVAFDVDTLAKYYKLHSSTVRAKLVRDNLLISMRRSHGKQKRRQ